MNENNTAAAAVNEWHCAVHGVHLGARCPMCVADGARVHWNATPVVPVGWRCPNCGRGNAPTTPSCCVPPDVTAQEKAP